MPAEIDQPSGTKVRSIAHCYITSYPYQSMADAQLRYIWMKHEVDANGVNISPPNECMSDLDLQVPFAAVANMAITPLDDDGNPIAALPVLPVSAIAAYIKGAGYQLLAHYLEKTGYYAPPAPPPEPAPE